MLLKLKEKFDFVMLDSAPLIVNDTRAILGQADVVLMVTRSGYTPNTVFRKTLEHIQEFRKGDIGVILNDVNMGLNRRYYNYRYGYK
jgi:Mrp family chromosome partitioning ATPase